MTVPAIKPQTGWGITTGHAGHEQQVLGVLEGLVDQPKMITVSPHGLAKFLAPWCPPNSDPNIKAPWPDVVVVSGRQVAPYARAISKKSNGKAFSVVLQDPKAPTSWYDFLWVNDHDSARGPNVMRTLTAPHRITQKRMEAAGVQLASHIAPLAGPYIGLILGGPNSAYKFGQDEAHSIGETVAALAKLRGASVLVTPSRRTGDERLQTIRSALGNTPHWIWDGVSDNPYFGILGLGDEFVVTCDSTNMLGEVAVTGKPLHIAKLNGKGGKFARLHQRLIEEGAAKWLSEMHAPWRYNPIDSRLAIIQEILRRYDAKKRLAT